METMQTGSVATTGESTVWIVPQKNRKRGLFLFFGTFIFLPLILVAWSVTNFVARQMLFSTVTEVGSAGALQIATQSPAFGALQMMNAILGFLGVLSFFLWIPGLVLMLRRTEQAPWSQFDARSGKGDQSVVPEEIKGWSWGAAFMGFPWGMYHRVWLTLIMLVPFVNMVWWIVMGIFGNEWAWRAMPWTSVEAFKAAQRPWKIWGIIFFVLSLISIVISFLVPILLAGFFLAAGGGAGAGGPGMMRY